MQMLKKNVALFQDGAKKCLHRDGHVCPIFAFVDGGEIKIAATTFRGPGDKDAFAEFMVGVIREHGVKEYLTVTEAWILKGDSETVGRQYRRYGSLEHVPEREEAVVICHCTPTTETMYVAKIERIDGKASLGDWETNERKVVALGAADGGSRFMGLFAKAASAACN